MNETRLKQLLMQDLPPVTERFHQAVASTLNCIAAEESRRNDAQRCKPLPVRRALLIAALMVLAIATVATAAIRWLVFDDLWPFAGTPNAADQVMQSHLAQVTVNNVEITVEEAGYDGRSLLLVYSYRMLDTDTPSGMDREDEGGLSACMEDLQRVADRGVGWWIDHIWFDGKAMDMPGNSYGDTRWVSGKLMERQVYRLDNESIRLNGPVEISLPIGERQPLADYTRLDHPEKYAEDGTLLLPQAGMVTFTLDTSGRLPLVVETPEVPFVMEELTAMVTEAAFSPLMTYITLQLEVSPQALTAYKAEYGEGFYDSEGNLIYRYDGTEIVAPWLYSLHLVDGTGRIVTTEGGNNGYGSDWAEFVYPAIENLPEELWLAPVENGQTDRSRAVRVR